MTHGTIPADHPKNPTYYERRAGFPAPDDDFYREIEDGKLVIPVYQHHKWVRGLDITTGQFYKLRKQIAAEIAARGIYKKNWKAIETQIVLYYIYAAIESNDLIQDKAIPAFWLRKMTAQFVDGVHAWMKQQQDQLNDNGELLSTWTTTAHWTKGPEWETKKFDGFLQLQHLDIVVRIPTNPEDPQNGIDVLEIPVSSITTRGKYTITPKDIQMSEISLDQLIVEIIERGYTQFDMTTHVFVYQGVGFDRRWMVIENNEDLHNAIAYQRKKLLKDMAIGDAAQILLMLDLRSHHKPGPFTNMVSSETRKRASGDGSSHRKGKKTRAIDF